MLPGIIFILAGVLLIVYPPLLPIVVAVFLISTGVMVISLACHNRRYRLLSC